MSLEASLLWLGRLLKPHGLRGELRLRAWIEDPSFLQGKTCFWRRAEKPSHPEHAPARESSHLHALSTTEDLHTALVSRCVSYKPGVCLVTFQEVKDRTAAERLSGRDLYISRADLPALQDAQDIFYQVDLVGTPVEDRHHTLIGNVEAFENFGAGDLVLIQHREGYQGLVPFHHDHIVMGETDHTMILSDLGLACLTLNRSSSAP